MSVRLIIPPLFVHPILFLITLLLAWFLAVPDAASATNSAVSVAGSHSPAVSGAGRRIIVRFKPGVLELPAAGKQSGSGAGTGGTLSGSLPVTGVELIKNYRFEKAAVTLPRLQQGPPSTTTTAIDISVLHIADPLKKREQVIADLLASGQVEYAEPDYVMSIDATPNDTSFSSLWGLHNTGQSGGTVDADIDAPEAWNITTGDQGIVVGVVDTGIWYDHPDLSTNMWRNPGEEGVDTNGMDKASNGVDDDGNGYTDDVYGIDCINGDSDPRDDNNHGTHVAGTIGAQGNNGSQVVGVNWNVSLMALKYLGSDGRGVTSDAVECLNYIYSMKKFHGINIRLINNSYGGGGFSQAMLDAIQATKDEGLLFVAAAGNDSTDNDIVPHYPASYSLDSIISVAGTNRNDGLYSNTSSGRTSVDLGAPGQSILSTTTNSSLSTFSGTSMATPHVAGVAALLWADDPGRSWQQVKGLILDTVDPNIALSEITLTGGRLNAHGALTCIPGSPKMQLLSPVAGSIAKISEDTLVGIKLSDCGNGVTGASVMATPNNGEPAFLLLDDGEFPDSIVGDGVYSANWIAVTPGSFSLGITATIGSATLNNSVDLNAILVPDYDINPAYPYSWIESSDGTDIGLGSVDDSGVEIPIGFDFSYYGSTYNSVWVHSNGLLKFGGDVELTFFEFLGLPNPKNPNNFIAPFWEDLNPGVNSGAIYSKLQGYAPNRRLVVQWHELLHFNQISENLPGTITFQAILYEGSNDIVIQYKDLTMGLPAYDFGARALVGIEFLDGSEGIVYINQGQTANTLSEQQAIRFFIDPAVVVSPASGLFTDEFGASTSFNVSLSSRPSSDVIIGLSSSNMNEGTVSPSSLTFTPGNATNSQIVTVTGVDDESMDGDALFTIITAAAVSADLDYNGMNPADVAVTNLDNDKDSDGDGIMDPQDNCIVVANPSQINSDFDTLGDACDADDDNDEIPDGSDNCPLDPNPAQKDTDGDGQGDSCDADADNDGVPDGSDNDTLNPFVCEDADGDSCDDCSSGVDGFGPLPDSDPLNDGTDTDGNGVCDIGDPDNDNDTVLDESDNCPLVSNLDQADEDGDGKGDVCDGIDETLCFPLMSNSNSISIICL